MRNRIGGPETMAGQLAHLLAVSSLPSVWLGVIPFGADRSALWPVESFFLYDDEQVNVELVSGHVTVTQPREVAMYATLFAQLSAQAVAGTEAHALITSAIGALRGRAVETG